MTKEKPELIVRDKNASRNYKLDESFKLELFLRGGGKIFKRIKN